MGSSVIFLLIIGLWAVFLVPHLVRHRADLGSSRARDRFSNAMRVLGRRPTAERESRTSSRSYLHRPRPQQQFVPTPTPAPRPAGRSSRRLPVTALAVLALLVGVVLAVPAGVVAALLGVVPGWVAAVPAAGLLAVLAVLRRRAVRRRRACASSRRPRVADLPPVPVTQAAATVPQPDEAAAAEVTQVARGETADDGTWTPVPVPPPTYTLKPPAPRRVAPPQPTAPSTAPSAAAGPTWDLDEVLERRRAAAG